MLGEGTIARKQPDGQITSLPRNARVQPCAQKYFALPVGQIISTDSGHPVPKEGVSRSSRTLGWDAVDAKALGAQSWSQGGFHEPVSDSQRADERRRRVRRSRVV